jgi:hypothetical protein
MDRIRFRGSEIFKKPKQSFPVFKSGLFNVPLDYLSLCVIVFAGHSVLIIKRKFPETFALVFTSNLTGYFKEPVIKKLRTSTRIGKEMQKIVVGVSCE